MSENLTRRAALGVLGVSSMALLAACGSKATSEASASASGSESASAAASESATASPLLLHRRLLPLPLLRPLRLLQRTLRCPTTIRITAA